MKIIDLTWFKPVKNSKDTLLFAEKLRWRSKQPGNSFDKLLPEISSMDDCHPLEAGIQTPTVDNNIFDDNVREEDGPISLTSKGSRKSEVLTTSCSNPIKAPLSLIQWRAVIGILNCRFLGLSKNSNLSRNFTTVFKIVLLCYHYFENAYIFVLKILYVFWFLHCQGDIELNPGPKNLKKTHSQLVIGILVA